MIVEDCRGGSFSISLLALYVVACWAHLLSFKDVSSPSHMYLPQCPSLGHYPFSIRSFISCNTCVGAISYRPTYMSCWWIWIHAICRRHCWAEYCCEYKIAAEAGSDGGSGQSAEPSHQAAGCIPAPKTAESCCGSGCHWASGGEVCRCCRVAEELWA